MTSWAQGKRSNARTLLGARSAAAVREFHFMLRGVRLEPGGKFKNEIEERRGSRRGVTSILSQGEVILGFTDMPSFL